eukprot:TRINITY_DN8661_c0_g2_i1.p1 TRINITY_DN8661_c0_g2~~TRINITY_DN8661_c0_g2_i1.p1  ORF type:complete len:202 (-),score=63.39 TRINITY_DN8661_c0_g2_i1:25-630(-)
MSTEIFQVTHKLQNTVALINKFEPNKLQSILIRVISKLHLKGTTPFTKEEEEKLEKVLDLNENDLEFALDTCGYIFEQIAYFNVLDLILLKSELEKLGFDSFHSIPFCDVWKKEGPSYLEKIKDVNIVPNRMESSSWRLHLEMGQSNLAKVKETSAIFQLNITNHDEDTTNNLQLEFDHSQLLQLYQKLELIQKQLDQLGV